jgi:Fe-S oxidoreductase
LASQLRKPPRTEPTEAPWLLRWSAGELEHEAGRCNGCGVCRTEAAPERMCPLFRVQRTEAATPRAKANLLRTLLAKAEGRNQVSTDEVRAVADLCINCRMCARECPLQIDIPRLMLEAKAQHAVENGLGWDDWVLARTEAFAAFGSAFSLLVNPLLESHPLRWLMERFLGVSRRRRVPPFARRSFLTIAERRGWTKQPRKPGVAYFVDVFANYNAPHIAEATVAVLHHHGVEVYVPPQQVGCGMAPLAVGDVEAARNAARKNVRVLAELARAGYTILCSEPTAALMLRQDYRRLLDDPDVELIAGRTRELTTFLWELHGKGQLRTDLRPVAATLGHHIPCHLKALGQGEPGTQLLALIPQLRALRIDLSCSGMAGTFGLKGANFDVSLQAGKPMLDRLRHRDIQLGVSECSACRMQMEQGARKRSLHPIEVLAQAYGLPVEQARI